MRIKIKDVGTVITGKTPSTKNKDFWDGNICFITIDDMNSNLCAIPSMTFGKRCVIIYKLFRVVLYLGRYERLCKRGGHNDERK